MRMYSVCAKLWYLYEHYCTQKKNQAAYKYTYGSLITICSFSDRDTKNSGDEEDNSGTEFDEESNRDYPLSLIHTGMKNQSAAKGLK